MGTLEYVPQTSSSELLIFSLIRGMAIKSPNSSSTCLTAFRFIIYYAVFNCVATYLWRSLSYTVSVFYPLLGLFIGGCSFVNAIITDEESFTMKLCFYCRQMYHILL